MILELVGGSGGFVKYIIMLLSMCMHRILLSTDVEAQADSFLETIPQG